MRRLNVKLFLGATAATAAAAVGIYVVHGLQSRRSAGALIDQVDRAEKKGDLNRAAQYLERYLSYAPGDSGALSRYGLMVQPVDPRTAPEDARRAAAAFEKVLIREPGRDEIRRRLAELQVKRGSYSAAVTHLDVLLKTRPEDGGLESLRGQCMEALGRFDEAVKMYEASRRHDKKAVDVYARLANILRRELNRPKEADRVMDAREVKDGLIASNGGSPEAYLARARYRKEFGIPGFEDDVAAAVKVGPDDAEAIVTAAGLAASRGAAGLDEARGLLRRGEKLHPGDGRMYLIRSAVEQGAGRPDAAIAALAAGVKALPDRWDIRWQFADAQITGGKLAEAEVTMKGLRGPNSLPGLLHYLDGRMLIARRKFPEAAKALESAVQGLAARQGLAELTKRAYLLLGACYDVLGKPDQQFAAYRRAADLTLPGGALDVPARLGVASALVARDRVDEAVAEYRKILALPGAPKDVRLALARLLVARDLRLPEARRQWSDAEQALDDAERALPGSSEVAILRAEVLLARDRPAQAAALVKAAREKAPDRIELWAAQIALERRNGKAEGALKLIDEAESRLGRRVEWLQARAAYWAGQSGPAAVEALDGLGRGAADLGAEDRLRLYPSLTEAYVRVGELKRARAVSRRWAEEDPANLNLRLALLDQAMLDDDRAECDRLLAEIRRLDTEGTLALYARAAVLARGAGKKGEPAGGENPLVEARRLLAEAARLRPNWARVPLLEAAIDEAEGRPESALNGYLKAIEMGERRPAAVLRATQMLFERGRYAQADQVLQKLQSQTGLTGEHQRLAAELALRSRDYDRAIVQARGAVAADPKDYRNHMWLGRMLYLAVKHAEAEGRKPGAGQLAEAEQALRRSVERAGDDGSPRVLLVKFLAGTGQKDQARAAVAEAEKAFPAGRSRLDLAQCYEALGDAARADAAYKEAVTAAPDDPATLLAAAKFALGNGRRKEAEALLRTLGGLDAKAPREAASARQTLAKLLAAGGDPKRAMEALDLLGTPAAGPGRKGEGPTADDRRARAEVLSLQASRAHRSEAIGILSDLIKEGVAVDTDRFLLARLYEADGNWAKARELFQGLIASDGKNPQYLAAYAMSLLNRRQPNEAEPWVSRFVRLQPDSPAATELKARQLYGQGRKAAAVDAVRAFLKVNGEQSLPFALILEGLGAVDGAEPLFREHAERSKDPQARFPLAGFLARRGRVREALDLCEAAWASAPAPVVSGVCVRLLTEAPNPDAADFRRVAAWLEEAVKKHPGATSIRFDLANVRAYQGQYGDAEAIYQALYEQDKGNTAPLNNRAWLLALQNGKGAEALPLIQHAVEQQGETPSLLDTRALVYLSLGRAPEAVRDLENALVTKPTAETYFHLARAYMAAGRRDDASLAIKTARELGLTVTSIHPLERPAYASLTGDLAKK